MSARSSGRNAAIRSAGFSPLRHPANRPRGRAWTAGTGARRVAGFTLLELIVVVALLGILTAVMLPEMRGSYSDAVLRAGSRDLAGVCAIASSRAVSFSRPHRVLVDPVTGKFRVERRGRAGAGPDGYVPVREVAGTEGVLDRRVHVQLRPAHTLDGAGLESGAGPAGPPGDGAAPPERATETDAGREGIGARPQAISFYPDGTADPVAIVLQDDDGFGLALRVNPVTGRVRVEELRKR